MAGVRLNGAFVDLIFIQPISEVAVVGIPFLLWPFETYFFL